MLQWIASNQLQMIEPIASLFQYVELTVVRDFDQLMVHIHLQIESVNENADIKLLQRMN